MPDKTTLEIIRGIVHSGDPCVKVIADRLNVSDNTVYKWAIGKESPDDTGSDMPVKWVVPLTSATKNYSLIEHLCRAVGGYFVKAPRVTSSDNDLRTVLKAMKASGSWIKEASDAMLDGTMTEEELYKLAIKGDEIVVCNEQIKLIIAQRKGVAA